MNSNATDFIESTSCVSWRTWIDVQGYADVCPTINPTKRMELRRINTTGEPRKPRNRLLCDLFSDIIDTSSFIAPRNVTSLHGYDPVSSFPSDTFLVSNQRRLNNTLQTFERYGSG